MRLLELNSNLPVYDDSNENYFNFNRSFLLCCKYALLRYRLEDARGEGVVGVTDMN